ncbi:MAG: shikimate kinase [Candidatus Magnetomorum sp.]|nr:shikimate kinase [Candidatus Magnetomorum sp.]
MANNIYLTGFMGSGKTTVGKQLSQCLDWPFVDMDAELVTIFNMPISEVFEKHGESAFRKMETQFMETLSLKKQHVVATGGGVPVVLQNRALMRCSGWIFYLNIDINDCKKRMTDKDIELRPLWKNEDNVRSLFKQRQAAYNDHHFQINVSGQSPETIVQTIIKQLKENGYV